MKATDNLDRLVVCVLRARAIAVPDNRMHQQMAIAREQGATFAFHHAQQLSILRLPVVSDIKPEQAQVPCECPEVAVCDKSLNGTDLQSLFRKQEISRLHRVNVDICIFRDRIREIDWLFV